MRASMPKAEGRVLALPPGSRSTEEVLNLAGQYAAGDVSWRPGLCPLSGAVYMRDEEHSALLNAVYAMYCHSNPLHSQKFPAVCRMEREAVSMAAGLVGGGEGTEVCGCITSGGTESILTARPLPLEKPSKPAALPRLFSSLFSYCNGRHSECRRLFPMRLRMSVAVLCFFAGG